MWIQVGVVCVYLVVVPLLAWYIKRNELVCETLRNGWLPVIISLLLSSLAGLVLKRAIRAFKSIAIYQPVVNGVGSNLPAIFSSRLSTALHRTARFGEYAAWAPQRWYNYLCDAFVGKNSNILLFLFVLVHLLQLV